MTKTKCDYGSENIMDYYIHVLKYKKTKHWPNFMPTITYGITLGISDFYAYFSLKNWK